MAARGDVVVGELSVKPSRNNSATELPRISELNAVQHPIMTSSTPLPAQTWTPHQSASITINVDAAIRTTLSQPYWEGITRATSNSWWQGRWIH